MMMMMIIFNFILTPRGNYTHSYLCGLPTAAVNFAERHLICTSIFAVIINALTVTIPLIPTTEELWHIARTPIVVLGDFQNSKKINA